MNIITEIVLLICDHIDEMNLFAFIENNTDLSNEYLQRVLQ